MSDISDIKHQIIEVCKRLYQKNLLAASDGNVSYRISDSEILITPSGLPKAFLKPEDLCLVDISGNIHLGKPSSERLMHLQVYKSCPEANAVVHAHPPHAVAWTIAFPSDEELPNTSLAEIILATGKIPIVPYARPSTQDMGDQLLPFVKDCRVMILARHGGLSWGESLQEAWMGMERLEHAAQMLFFASRLGGLTHLPNEEIEILKEMRKQIGPKTL